MTLINLLFNFMLLYNVLKDVKSSRLPLMLLKSNTKKIMFYFHLPVLCVVVSIETFAICIRTPL